MSEKRHADVAIIGTGMGGGTLAWTLRDAGASILLLERGDFLPSEPQNWSPRAVFVENRYKAAEKWRDAAGGWFSPGVHYFVGGNTKVYGAALPRLREADFGEIQHAGGVSPAWPIAYADLAPYYDRAERLYAVHGEAGADPTDPPRSGPFPYPPMPGDPYMDELAGRLRDQGLHPAPLPVGLDFRPGGACIRCGTCDAFPCRVLAKGDADTRAVRPALASPNVELWTNAYARRLTTSPSGDRVTGVEVLRSGEVMQIEADLVVVACGAVNSAALLLRSATDRHPDGLGNSSGLVGRNYMVHNNSVLVAIDPRRENRTIFQKTISINDFYLAGADDAFPFPMGNLQPVGKLRGPMMRGAAPYAPGWALDAAARHSVDWWVMSEDLPDPANRVTLDRDGTIVIHWQPNNLAAHDRLMSHAKRMLRRAGYPILLSRTMGIATNSHQCGTLRFGHDAACSVLDPYGRAHDLDNLYVGDASCFPSSTAVNPALTIAAQALRVGDHLLTRLGGGPRCRKRTRSTTGMTKSGSRLEGYRRRRDHFFAEHPHSPLTDDQKARFHGLAYFPEREDLALNLPLDESAPEVGEEISLETTDGKVKTFVRGGRIELEVDGTPIALTVLRDGEHGSWFIPFRDASAGTETYEVGRYLEPQSRPDGTLDVDFNYAYNPFCAYGEGWSCPIPPAENQLPVTVAAGERRFQLGGDES